MQQTVQHITPGQPLHEVDPGEALVAWLRGQVVHWGENLSLAQVDAALRAGKDLGLKRGVFGLMGWAVLQQFLTEQDTRDGMRLWLARRVGEWVEGPIGERLSSKEGIAWLMKSLA